MVRKNKYCMRCVLRDDCGDDLPGFCYLIPYSAIIGVIVMLAYLFYSSLL